MEFAAVKGFAGIVLCCDQLLQSCRSLNKPNWKDDILSLRLPIIHSDTTRRDAIFGQRLRLRLKCEGAQYAARSCMATQRQDLFAVEHQKKSIDSRLRISAGARCRRNSFEILILP